MLASYQEVIIIIFENISFFSDLCIPLKRTKQMAKDVSGGVSQVTMTATIYFFQILKQRTKIEKDDLQRILELRGARQSEQKYAI